VLDKLFRPRTVAGIVLTLVIAAGTAVAATDTGPRPTVLEGDETTTTSTTELATTSTAVEETTTSTTEAPTTTTTAAAKPDTPSHDGHPDNHGACVSAAAHDTPPGPDHGAAVSKVAHSDCGKDASAKGADAADDHEAPETEAPENDSHAGGAPHGQGDESSDG